MATELLLIQFQSPAEEQIGTEIVRGILQAGKYALPAAEWMLFQTPYSLGGFFVTENLPETRTAATRLFGDFFPKFSERNSEFYSNAEALHHYFDILFGLSSPIPGNVLFLENLKEGYTLSLEMGLTGPILNQLFQMSVVFYRKMQEDSPVLQGATSLPDAILELAEKIFDDRKNVQVGIWGDPAEAAGYLRFFRSHKVQAAHMTATEPEEACLPSHKDILARISNAALPRNFTQQLMAERRNRQNRPFLFIDLSSDPVAIPPNEVFLYYNSEDLHAIIRRNYAERKKAVPTIRPKIENEIRKFLSWLYSRERFEFSGIIGRSRSLVRVLEMVARVSNSDVTILIEGESGTGKELIAKAIHQNSLRAKRPFVVVNSAAIPDPLLESELFGHVKGAFSGAFFSKKGLFEEADHGTIFLDEIGEMSLSTQAKILRVLQNGEIRRVGSTATLYVDVRLIAATNKNLSRLVKDGRFREDLYYRLKVLHILVPPLRERPEDIEELAYYFLERFSQKLGKHLTAISPETMTLLKAYPWPGNVRELENAIERAVVMTIGQRLTPTDLPEEIQFFNNSSSIEKSRWPTLHELEKHHILRTLEHVNWNLGRATELLGISRATLWRKLKEYGIQQRETP